MFHATFVARAKACIIDHFILCLPVGFVSALFVDSIIGFFGFHIDYSGGMSIIVPLMSMVYSAVPVIGILDAYNNLLGSHTSQAAMFAQSLTIIISIILIEASINTVQESFSNKLTIGKGLMRIRVVRYDGSECPIFIKFLRNIFRSLNKFIFFIPAISIIFTAKKQTLYDLLLKTISVKC